MRVVIQLKQADTVEQRHVTRGPHDSAQTERHGLDDLRYGNL